MVVVLDTNVIISALLSSRCAPAEIIKRWEAGQFEVATSPALLDELERALAYDRVARYLRQRSGTAAALVERLRSIAVVVTPSLDLHVIAEDPADDRVLECAVAGGASYIVTGDAHLLRAREYEGIVILSPAGFLIVARAAAAE